MRQESNVDQILKEYEKTFTHQQLIDGDYPASLDTSKKEVRPLSWVFYKTTLLLTNNTGLSL